MGDHVGAGCENVVRNDPPTGVVLSNDTVEENRPVSALVGTLTATDPDPNDTHRFTLVGGSGSTDNPSFTINGNRLLTAAVFDFETKASYSIRIQARDAEGSVFAEPFTITVSDTFENLPPVAVDDTVDAVEDDVRELPVTGAGSPAENDTDGNGDTLTVSAASGATGGAVTITGGVIRFTPTPNLWGAGAGGFSYTVGDGRGATDIGAVTVDIGCVDDFPVAVDDAATVAEDAAATAIPVFANDTDIDAGPLLIDAVTQPENGTVVIEVNGSG